MFSFINDLYNYETRKVGKDKVNGITVSTAYTSDEGYETAILDEEGTHPVERYETKEKAETGHKFWCEKAKTIEKVIKLGWLGVIEDEEITIVRNK